LGTRRWFRPVLAEHQHRLRTDSALADAYTQTFAYPAETLDRLASGGMPRHLFDKLVEAQRIAANLPDNLSIDKAWHGLQTLLADRTPLNRAIQGGDDGLIEPAEVRTIHAAFAAGAADGLRDTFDADRFTADHVTPDIWHEPDAIEFLLGHLSAVKGLYRAAANDGRGLITWLA
jgi:hypothetical protein